MGSGRSQASDRPATTAVGHPLDTLFGPWFAAILAKFEKSCRPGPIRSAGTHKLTNWVPIAATRRVAAMARAEGLDASVPCAQYHHCEQRNITL